MSNLPPRFTDGSLPRFTDLGGYPLVYFTRDGLTVCPECANRPVDRSQEVTGCDVNWEDANLFCDDCGRRIESAYAEPEQPVTRRLAP